MIAKIGKILFARERISKFKKLSNMSFIAGIILLIIYPFLSDNIFIVEKQLKFSEGFNIFQDKEKFFMNSKEFNKKYNDWFKNTIENKKLYYDFNNNQNRKNLFSDYISDFLSRIDTTNTIVYKNQININSDNEKINTIHIRSQRGDFTKSIIVNFIFDSDKNPSYNSFDLVYAFLKNFENKFFFNWMSKDLFINFISKDLFYNNPKNFVEFLKQEPILNEIFPEFYINIDLSRLGYSFLRSDSYNIFLKINGVNSENIDMDYYKLFFDNFVKIINDNYNSRQFSIKTFENNIEFLNSDNFSKKINNVKNLIVKHLSTLFDTNGIKNSIVYKDLHKYYSYLLNNIFENYLNFKRNIDSNDILISEGKLSILLKIESNTKNKFSYDDGFHSIKTFDKNMINFGFNIFCVVERALKNLNKVEIDIFRGDHNYILTNNNKFQGTGLFILIPVLCVIRIFYEILDKVLMIHNYEYELYEDINNEKYNFSNRSKEELKLDLKSLLLKDKLINFASFQFLIILFVASFFNLSEILSFIEKNEHLKKFSILFDLKRDEENFINGLFLILALLFLMNLVRIILKKILNKHHIQSYMIIITEHLSIELKNNFSALRKKVEDEISNVIDLFYLGLNLFLIFFINYGLGLFYIILLMIPEFLKLIIENILQVRNQALNREISILKKSTIITLESFTFVPIGLIIYMDSSNEIVNHFTKILLNKDGYNYTLKFLYMDILIFYCLRLQKIFAKLI